ncbi:hypothetical protein GGI04_002138 [Coemansia thaxteri]|uniref:MSP domain-containing protein n=1 Tax=Coemansia thaxteri TaxID=2663907 RepID=A0A9W8BGN6_9FUNG|nr:hypothetical protein GGI04_002138 [Coemansia thaxteri]KAJ2007039.1 hypothetical protein H4R26_001039 [Coemansia thaxteri]KAJ2470784.1 hypothetical protein GGI02_002705 [Coemansia sp. RSA 2322]KAJ2487117.1 hypothetical protein EV174_000729 [Coemansia sp. RSA 2320]
MPSLPLIRISPSEFQFTESGSGYTSRLRLTSLQQQAVGFKFKTNAPHKFLVKPVVCSLTKMGMAVDVTVKSSSPITAADRFLIQTVALDADEAEDLDSTKWRKLDPARIMEDLIHCTAGLRRPSTTSTLRPPSPTPPPAACPPLVAVSHVYDNRTQFAYSTSYQKQEYSTTTLANSATSAALVKRFYAIMPGIQVDDWSWAEFAMFAAACILLGFFLPVIRYATT